MSSSAQHVRHDVAPAKTPELTLVTSPSAAPPATPTVSSRSAASRWPARLRAAASVTIPPIVTLAILIGIWQIACSEPGSSLPTPSAVVTETWELIAHPWYDNGGIDKGIGWHLIASL